YVTEIPGINTIKEAMDYCKDKSGFEFEGIVAVDMDFNRVKIKCPDYVQKHHSFSNMDLKGLIQIIMKAESDEVLVYFPEWKPDLDNLRKKIASVLYEMVHEYKKYKDLETRKEFALAIKDHPFKSFFF